LTTVFDNTDSQRSVATVGGAPGRYIGIQSTQTRRWRFATFGLLNTKSRRSGFPLATTTLSNNTNSFGGGQRQNIVGDPHVDHPSVDRWSTQRLSPSLRRYRPVSLLHSQTTALQRQGIPQVEWGPGLE